MHWQASFHTARNGWNPTKSHLLYIAGRTADQPKGVERYLGGYAAALSASFEDEALLGCYVSVEGLKSVTAESNDRKGLNYVCRIEFAKSC